MNTLLDHVFAKLASSVTPQRAKAIVRFMAGDMEQAIKASKSRTVGGLASDARRVMEPKWGETVRDPSVQEALGGLGDRFTRRAIRAHSPTTAALARRQELAHKGKVPMLPGF